jgi:N-acetylglutamate synthase-like GNAT family acetyltransferase
MLIKRMDEKNIMLAVSREELYNISEVFSTYITVGKGDNITMKMSKQIQDFLIEEEKNKLTTRG